MSRFLSVGLVVAVTLVSLAAFGLLSGSRVDGAPPPAVRAPVFGEEFWSHWGDGRAELAAYDLTYKRYGEQRNGVAVAIFVTETLSYESRVKTDSTAGDPSNLLPVMKLNLVQDFPTGLYDYNLMTSAFVGLTERDGQPAGSTTKISFSSQEWCGMTFSQFLFDPSSVRYTSHSYFEGEADQERELERPRNGFAMDALLLWARGLAGPALAPGETADIPLLESLESARLKHRSPSWVRARLSRSTQSDRLDVPAGSFEVDEMTAVAGDARLRFFVETAAPHRVIRWEMNDGTQADLLAAERLRYWEMSGVGLERQLERLGLHPRPPRTP